jgi:hypothetical protein
MMGWVNMTRSYSEQDGRAILAGYQRDYPSCIYRLVEVIGIDERGYEIYKKMEAK